MRLSRALPSSEPHPITLITTILLVLLALVALGGFSLWAEGKKVLVVTDEEGVPTLGDVVAAPIETEVNAGLDVRILAVRGVPA